LLGFIATRALQAAVTMLVLSFGLFVGVFAIGDPIAILISADAGPEEIETATRALGLDKPFHLQYLAFLANLATGSLGKSFFYNQPP
jgi:peptide/nickel transport system permease protein